MWNKYLLLHSSQPPFFYRWLFPNAIWKQPSQHKKKVYLTFDDGPTPRITEAALDLLERYKCVATFFCLGKNVEQHPDLYQQIRQKGHAIGNHSFSHFDGWQTPAQPYVDDALKANHYITSAYYRPPYGKLMPKQFTMLSHHFRIVMWDVLTGDYNPDFTADMCFENVRKHAVNGSIIVFHDSIKAAPRMVPALEKTLVFLIENGFETAKFE